MQKLAQQMLQQRITDSLQSPWHMKFHKKGTSVHDVLTNLSAHGFTSMKPCAHELFKGL